MESKKQCANQAACPSWQVAYRTNNPACAECGADVASHRIITRLCDQLLDQLVDKVDHNTPETMMSQLIAACHALTQEADKAGVSGSVTLPEAGYALQLRSLQIISDLRRAIRHGHA